MVNDEINTNPLRNAPLLPEDESDSQSDSASEQEEVNHDVSHLQIRQRDYHAEATVFLQQFTIQSLLFIQTVWTILTAVASTTGTITRGVVRSLQTPLYVFFKGSTHPYRKQDVTLSGPGIAPVEWYYNQKTKQFISSAVYNTTTEYDTHHFEWLTGEIKYNGLVLYDISDFLEDIRYTGTSKPSTAHVLSAWSLDSGIVLDQMDGLTLQTINADGTESTLQYRG